MNLLDKSVRLFERAVMKGDAMQLQEIMDTNFDVISANDFAEDALELMRIHQKNALFVLGQNTIEGVIRYEEVRNLRPEELRRKSVADLMCRMAYRVPPETSVEEAARLLDHRPEACLFVVWNNQPIGVLTSGRLRNTMRRLRNGRPALEQPSGAEHVRTARMIRQ